MSDLQRELLHAALGYAARGWHVIPLRVFDKRPAFPDHCAPTPGQSGAGHGAAGECRRDLRCARAGRHVSWAERATTDPDRIIRAWGTQPPGTPSTQQQTPVTRPARWGGHGPYGIGIACGPSGLLVVDLDQPKPDRRTGAPFVFPKAWQLPGVRDGHDVLAVLADRAGAPDPATLGTYTVRTPSGGTHLYFTQPSGDCPGSGPTSGDSTGGGSTSGRMALGNTTGDLGPLVDTRGWGGQVVAAPTLLRAPAPAPADRRSGRHQQRKQYGQYGRYQVDDPGAEVLPLPGWLAELLTKRPTPLGQTSTPTAGPPTAQRGRASAGRGGLDERAVRYVRAAVDKTVQAVLAAEPGRRNRTLYGRAVSLGQLVAGGVLDADHAAAVLLEAGTAIGQSEREAAATIASGLRAGAGHPRTIPPGPHAGPHAGPAAGPTVNPAVLPGAGTAA